MDLITFFFEWYFVVPSESLTLLCDFTGRSLPLELAQGVELVTPDTSPHVSWVGSGHETTQ